MRVTMTQAWDRASEVLADRQAVLAPIAIATLWLPAVVRQAIGALLLGDATTPPTGGASAVIGLLGIAAALIGLWGKLALVAVASDRAATVPAALQVGLRRWPLMIGLAALLVLGAVIVAVPLAIVAAPFAAHITAYDSAAMAAPITSVPAGQRAFFVLYVLALVLVFIWLAVRLATLGPVVVDERAGLGSFRRSFHVTRGHFWRLLGVLVLFGIVIGVAGIAVQAVTGIVFRLLVGAHPGWVALLTTIFTAAVMAAGNVVGLVFTTSFYLLRREATPLS